MLGGNNRLSEFQGAILHAQWECFEEQAQRREENGRYLAERLSSIPGVYPQARTADCTRHDLPLMLEPLSYSLDPTRKKLPTAEKRRVVVETARRLVIEGVDVLKAEFPLDVATELDERVWSDACIELCPSGALRKAITIGEGRAAKALIIKG